MVRAEPDMAKIESYPLHGGQLQQIAQRFRIPVSQLLDFSANINPEGPPSSVLSTLRASLDDLSALTEYPDLQLTELKRAIAGGARVATPNITVANGFVPLLDAVLRALPIRRCLLPVPAFAEYRKTLGHAGVETAPYALNPASNFKYDAAAIVAGDEDAILLANPQNPSGICHDAAVLRAIRKLKLKLQVIFNQESVMILPRGTSKSTGLSAALSELGISSESVVGIGDAENDHDLLSLCGCAVAVANAIPALKKRADVVTGGSYGAGVLEVIHGLIDKDSLC